MCGIFGLVARRHAPYNGTFLSRSLETLGNRSQSRGRDSSGLAVRSDGDSTITVFKGAIPIGELLDDKRLERCVSETLNKFEGGSNKTFTALGHSRLVTNGSQLNDENNQPVIKDGIVAIHNGIVVNDVELWGDNPELDRTYQIDTEVLVSLIRKYMREGWPLTGAMARAEQDVRGTVATAMLFDDVDALLLATNNGSLYTLTDHENILLFASEKHPLAFVSEKMGLNDTRFSLRQVRAWSGIVARLDTFALEPFEFDTALAAGRSQTHPEKQDRCRINVTPIESECDQIELVQDTALISKAPEAAENKALLEYHPELIAELKRCSRCVLPETFPFISFDDLGVCNYCNNYKIKNQPKPLDNLLAVIEPYRRKDGQPDCIVPFSGGRDSTYALHLIKNKLGLNPIAFTYDWGMVTDLGRRNIARVCGKLGVENIIVAADIRWKRSNIRKNINAWLRRPHLGMIPLFMAGDKYFYYYVDQVKQQTGINLNLWGINPMENTDFKVGYMGVAPDFEKKRIYTLSAGRQIRLLRGVAGAVLANPGYLNGSLLDTTGSFFVRMLKRHSHYHHLFDYYRWDEEEIDTLLFEEYQWERAIDTDTTWRIGDGTAAFYNYIYYTVGGFSEHDTFRSNQIREGMLSREKALQLVELENQPRYPTIKWYTDVVQVDYRHAIQTINKLPKSYPRG